jgi:16S rRNA (guanine527-N7)-methyltransferase
VRAEEWAAADGREAYDAVTVRAVGPLPVLLEYAAPLLRLDGALVAWKGARDTDEEGAAEAVAPLLGMAGAEVLRVVPFRGVRDRHLHVFAKREPTPERFPRRPGTARKRPLGS